MTSETLTRLPIWAARSCEATLLKQSECQEDEAVHIVLNKAACYTDLDCLPETDAPDLPLIMERKRKTISTVVGCGTFAPGGEMRFQGETRKRLGWREDWTRKKPRQD